jgi:hypothetical protein
MGRSFLDLMGCRNVIGRSAHEFLIIRDPIADDENIVGLEVMLE